MSRRREDGENLGNITDEYRKGARNYILERSRDRLKLRTLYKDNTDEAISERVRLLYRFDIWAHAEFLTTVFNYSLPGNYDENTADPEDLEASNGMRYAFQQYGVDIDKRLVCKRHEDIIVICSEDKLFDKAVVAFGFSGTFPAKVAIKEDGVGAEKTVYKSLFFIVFNDRDQLRFQRFAISDVGDDEAEMLFGVIFGDFLFSPAKNTVYDAVKTTGDNNDLPLNVKNHYSLVFAPPFPETSVLSKKWIGSSLKDDS